MISLLKGRVIKMQYREELDGPVQTCSSHGVAVR